MPAAHNVKPSWLINSTPIDLEKSKTIFFRNLFSLEIIKFHLMFLHYWIYGLNLIKAISDVSRAILISGRYSGKQTLSYCLRNNEQIPDFGNILLIYIFFSREQGKNMSQPPVSVPNKEYQYQDRKRFQWNTMAIILVLTYQTTLA